MTFFMVKRFSHLKTRLDFRRERNSAKECQRLISGEDVAWMERHTTKKTNFMEEECLERNGSGNERF